MSTFVIAEAGVNHNGSLENALELVGVAARAGADAVKFQTFSADATIAPGTPTLDYQKLTTGQNDQHQLLKDLEFTRSEWGRIVQEAERCQIEFMSTAFDPAAADLLLEFGIKRVKVPSGEVTNHPFLRHLARAGLPVILSTGMADLPEIHAAVAVIESVQNEQRSGIDRAERLVVLQCTTAYPTPPHDVNLLAMQTLARELKVPVGFSDHTSGILLSPVAVGMGAQVIEKHFTLDRTMHGPDHAASLEPAELTSMIENIRLVEKALGDGRKVPRSSELEARRLARRGIKAARGLLEGSILGISDVAILRPETGAAPADLERLVGRRLTRSLQPGEPLSWRDTAD